MSRLVETDPEEGPPDIIKTEPMKSVSVVCGNGHTDQVNLRFPPAAGQETGTVCLARIEGLSLCLAPHVVAPGKQP